MRKEKGITLIALIITIIVMLILVGVTINVAINGGLLGKTEKVAFQTQVRQIQEALQIKKAILLANDLEALENTSSITLDDLDIDSKLKTKFTPKLIISKETDDFVLYYSEANTNQEKIWLEELGVYAKVAANFIDDAIDIVGKSDKDILINGRTYNYVKIYEDIKTKYPSAVVLTWSEKTKNMADYGKGSYAFEKKSYNIITTIDMLDKTYADKTTPITTEIKQKVIESINTLEEPLITEEQFNNNFFENSATVADLIRKFEHYIENYAEKSNIDDLGYLVINRNDNGYDKVLINKNGVEIFEFPNDEWIIMSKTEADDNFKYEIATDENDSEMIDGAITITEYTGDRKIIKVPRLIMDDEKGEGLLVTSIQANAFSALESGTGNFLPVRLEMPTAMLNPMLAEQGSPKMYDELTTDELATTLSIPNYDSTEYENTRAGKNKLLIDYLLPTILPAPEEGEVLDPYEYIELEGTGNEQLVYAYAKANSDRSTTIYKKNEVDNYINAIEQIIISEGIFKIAGDNILAGNCVVDIYIPKSLTDISSNALANTQNIAKIRTRKTEDELKEMSPGYYVFGSRYENRDCEFMTD